MKSTTALIIIFVFIAGLIFGYLSSTMVMAPTIITEIKTTSIAHTIIKTTTNYQTFLTTVYKTTTIERGVDGTISEVCFSKPQKCDALIANILRGAQRYAYVAVYSFTNDLLADVLIELKSRGVEVKVVMEGQQANIRGSEYQRLAEAGVEVRIDGNPDLMHHKFVVIDDKTVITGSYNWSVAAEDKNDENLIVIQSREIALLYRSEFERVWMEAT